MRRCGTCLYFDRTEPDADDGVCRYSPPNTVVVMDSDHPPQPHLLTVWPKVRPSMDWCREHMETRRP